MIDKKHMKKVYNSIFAVILLVVFAIIAYGSFYTVDEQQQAVITQFGRAVGVEGAGAHFIVPLMQRYEKVDMFTRGMEFGYFNVSGYDSSVESESFMITKDFNFVNVDFYVEWKVSDPVKFLFNADNPEGLLRNILQSEARSVVSSYIVDDVLTTAKSEIQTKIRDGVAIKLEEYDIGIIVSNVSLQDASPPTKEVEMAFKNVENAKQNKDTQINQANSYYNEIIPGARAEADKIIKEAEGVKESRINEGIGQTAKFNAMFEEYAQNKDITKTRMYLEAMEDILPGITVYADGDGEDLLKVLNLSPATDNPEVNGGVLHGN